MKKELLLKEIKSSQEFFERSTRVLTEEDSNFAPTKEMLTVAQQVLHTANCISWFVEGAFSQDGFDMDFETHTAEYKKAHSLTEARKAVSESFAKVIKTIETSSDAELSAPIAVNPIMSGEPRYSAFFGIVEHTAHHRGALSVYSRLLGKIPLMPYMEM